MHSGLVAVLERSRGLGFLGPGPVQAHVDHAAAFVAALEHVSGLVVDLGSGGGVPGLVVAVERPELSFVLLDAMAKRCRFLEWALVELELIGRARVVEGRAEEIGRSELRASAAAVLARSFGPPAVTAECASPLLLTGGVLVVSEPPENVDRWPAAELAQLGMRPLPPEVDGPVRVVVQDEPCPDRFPRRTGIPAKRPLF